MVVRVAIAMLAISTVFVAGSAEARGHRFFGRHGHDQCIPSCNSAPCCNYSTGCCFVDSGCTFECCSSECCSGEWCGVCESSESSNQSGSWGSSAGDIAELQEEVAELRGKVEGLEGDVAALKAQAGTANSSN